MISIKDFEGLEEAWQRLGGGLVEIALKYPKTDIFKESLIIKFDILSVALRRYSNTDIRTILEQKLML